MQIGGSENDDVFQCDFDLDSKNLQKPISRWIFGGIATTLIFVCDVENFAMKTLTLVEPTNSSSKEQDCCICVRTRACSNKTICRQRFEKSSTGKNSIHIHP